MMNDKHISGQPAGGLPLARLVEECSFEDVVDILLHGALPEGPGGGVQSVLAAQRELPEQLRDFFRRLPRSAPVMDCLIAAAAWLGAADPDAGDGSREARFRQSLRMIALLPTIAAAAFRISIGLNPIRPLARLSHTRNFLYMLSGHGPDEDAVSALDDLLILAALDRITALPDHSDYHSVVTGALCALKASGIDAGIERTLPTLRELREHRSEDDDMCESPGGAPDERTRYLKRLVARLSECTGETAWPVLCEKTVQRLKRDDAGRSAEGLYYAAVLHLIGVPPSLYAPVLALGMIAGWSGRLVDRTDASPRPAGVSSPGHEIASASTHPGIAVQQSVPPSTI